MWGSTVKAGTEKVRAEKRIWIRLALGVIRSYQLLLSPILGPSCRFYPSCSSYAMEAISGYGLLRGTMLSIKRILKCHPLHPGGYDPVN